MLTPLGTSLSQAYAHCLIFFTAAFLLSLGIISIPLWLIILSNQLSLVDLTNLRYQLSPDLWYTNTPPAFAFRILPVLILSLTRPHTQLSPHILACIKYVPSSHPEPRSNSHFFYPLIPLHSFFLH